MDVLKLIRDVITVSTNLSQESLMVETLWDLKVVSRCWDPFDYSELELWCTPLVSILCLSSEHASLHWDQSEHQGLWLEHQT